MVSTLHIYIINQWKIKQNYYLYIFILGGFNFTYYFAPPSSFSFFGSCYTHHFTMNFPLTHILCIYFPYQKKKKSYLSLSLNFFSFFLDFYSLFYLYLYLRLMYICFLEFYFLKFFYKKILTAHRRISQ